MSATLDYLLRDIRPWMDEPGIEDLCLSPGACFAWKDGRFEERTTSLGARELEDLAIVAGAQRRQDITPDWPLLDTELPGRGRLSAVLYPCVPEGEPALTIRLTGGFDPSLDELTAQGMFDRTALPGAGRVMDAELREFYSEERFPEFLRRAVRARKTIVLSGENSSGKTTVARALAKEIPLHERIITAEDTPEFGKSIPHRNRVSLLYDKNNRGPGPQKLVEAALRMRIGRFMFQELRDGASTLAFMAVLNSGHAGSITTVHAGSASDAFERLRVMVKEEPAGRAMEDGDITHPAAGAHRCCHSLRSVSGRASRQGGSMDRRTCLRMAVAALLLGALWLAIASLRVRLAGRASARLQRPGWLPGASFGRGWPTWATMRQRRAG